MKKSILVVFLCIFLSVSAFGAADRVDMIVLLDNSVSVLPYYDDIQNSLIKKIISEHLSPGDTFSLITFADQPAVEISREIKNKDDIDEILAYSSILQPMGNYTDLVLALRFLYKYTLDLPLSNKKKIIILTDGIHDPPVDSPFFLEDQNKVDSEVRKAADDIHREGWDVSIVEIENNVENDLNKDLIGDSAGPSGDSSDIAAETDGTDDNVDPEEGGTRTNVLDTVADSLGSKPNKFNNTETDMAAIALGIPLISIPEHLGTVKGELKVPLHVLNRGNEVLFFSVSAVTSEGVDLLKEKNSIRLNPSEEGTLELKLDIPVGDDGPLTGEQTKEIALRLVGGLKTEPSKLVLRYNIEKKGGLSQGVNFITDWRVIAVVIAIIVALLVILLIKRLSLFVAHDKGSFSEGSEIKKNIPATDDVKLPVTAAEQEVQHIQHEPEEYLLASISTDTDIPESYRKNRPVQMLVYGQNTKLGISNVKWLGLNKKRSVGSSGSSVFRIFFLRVPSVIAYIECTGEDFIFYPEKKEFFPELEGPMTHCLNKRIKIINSDNKMFFIEFRQWISALEKVNRLLSMTKYSGSPDMDF